MEKWKSRKLWVTVLTAALTAMNGVLDLVPESQRQWILGMIMTYIGGQSVADAAKELKK